MENAQKVNEKAKLRELSIVIHGSCNNQMYTGDHIEVHIHPGKRDETVPFDESISDLVQDALSGIRRAESEAEVVRK